MKNLLVTASILSALLIVMGNGDVDPYVAVGKIIGIITVPLFNAHLVSKYMDFSFAKKRPLLAMIIVGIVSLFINSMLIFLVIIGSIGLNKIKSHKKT